jgi:hypothetical protein
MQRVFVDRPLHRPRVAHELGAVQYFDGFLRGQPRRDQLPPARVAEHQVRLDEAERDVQVRRHEALVDVHRRPRLGRSQVPVGCEVARIVVHYPHAGSDLLAADLADLRVGGGAMQAGRDQDRDVLARDTRAFQPREDRRQRLAIRRRTRDVADRDCGAALSPREFVQRWRRYRSIQRGLDRRLPVGKRLRRPRLQNPILKPLGQLHGEARLPERQVGTHQGHPTTPGGLRYLGSANAT